MPLFLTARKLKKFILQKPNLQAYLVSYNLTLEKVKTRKSIGRNVVLAVT